MKVATIMTQDVAVCADSETLNRAAQLMWENDCGCVPIVDLHSKIVGILTDRDICMAAYTRGANLDAIQTADAMATHPFTCRQDDDLATAQEIMRKHCVRRLPVVASDGKLVGILSLSDIARITGQPDAKAEVADTLVAVSTPRQHVKAAKVREEPKRASRSKRTVSRSVLPKQ
jgi:CBS domain-containing protein